MFIRKTIMQLLTAALGMAFAGLAAAQTYPAQPIKLLVPFSAGGGTDILSRILAQKMSENMGQQIVVENKPGGNTLIATEALVRAAPDGYTLLMQTNNLAANPTMYRGKLSFDTIKDLVPVSLVAGNPHVLVVNPALPARDLKEYIALAKAKPGKITFASAGSGTVNHLSGELLKMLSGIDIVHVPYKGSGAVMPDLLGGHVDSLFAAMPTVTGFIKENKLRALGSDHDQSVSRFAGCAHHRRTGLRKVQLQFVVRHSCSGRHAQSDRGAPANRDHQGSEASIRAGKTR